jgi:hypothetical protein
MATNATSIARRRRLKRFPFFEAESIHSRRWASVRGKIVRAAHAPERFTLDTAANLAISVIHDEIRTLLDAPAGGDAAPSLGDIEHTLTAGYARALALEAERWRLERQIAEVAAKLGDESSEFQHSELATLGQRLSLANGDLKSLRGLLSSLRSRAAEVRAGVSA